MITSSYQVGNSQRDGRKYVTFSFTLDSGEIVRTERGPLSDTSGGVLDTRLSQIGAAVELAKGDSEATDKLSRVAALALQNQTAAQFADRVRNRYHAASKEELCQIAWWLIEMLAAGFVTDLQLRTAFGLTAGQWTTFKSAKVQPAHDAWATVLLAQGE